MEDLEPRTPPSFTIQIRSDSRRIGSENGVIIYPRSQQAKLLVKREVDEDTVSLLRRPSPNTQHQDDLEIITLSSDEEVEIERDEDNHINEDVSILPDDVKMEPIEPEVEAANFELQDEEENFETPKRKSERRKLQTRKFSEIYTLERNNRTGRHNTQFISDFNPHQGRNGDHQQTICQYCGRNFTTMKALAEHIQKQHMHPKGPPGLFKCDTCGKLLKSEHSLTLHQVTHSDDRPYSCDLCKTKYKSQFYLDRHCKSKGHKNVESLQKYIERRSLSGGTTVNGRANGNLSPPPPPLSAETSTEMGSPPKARQVYPIMSARKTFSRTTSLPTRKLSSVSTASTGTSTSQNQNSTSTSTSTQQQPQGIDMTSMNGSNGVVTSMMPSMQGMASPIMFYGYMMQPNGTPYSGNVLPAIQPSQYYSPQVKMLEGGGASYVPYSGMNGMGMLPQQMQQMSFQPQQFQGQSQMLTCFDCQAQFSVDAHLRSHIKEFHSTKCWKCPKCSDVMLSPAEFEQHYSQCSKVP